MFNEIYGGDINNMIDFQNDRLKNERFDFQFRKE